MLSGFRAGAQRMPSISQPPIPQSVASPEPAQRAHAPPRRPSRLLALALLLIGSSGIAAAWVLYAYASDQQASWIAVLAAVDAAVLLRLARMPGGWTRACWGASATALAIALANWGIAGAQMGKAMGLMPWDSLLRLGPHFTWTLTTLANNRVDLAWWCAALVVAVLASR